MKKAALLFSLLLNAVLATVSVNLWLDLRARSLGLESKWLAARSVVGASTLPHVKIEFRVASVEPGPNLTPVRNPESGETLYASPEVALGNSDIRTVIATNDTYGQPAIDIFFTDTGVAKIQQVTTANVGKRLAVLVDGSVLFAPVIVGPISDRHTLVRGLFDKETTQRIVLAFSRG
jgi:preprotein translocase subunit SecD